VGVSVCADIEVENEIFDQTLLSGVEGGMMRGLCFGDMVTEQRVPAWGSQTIQGP
jgi:hypothetical protein